MRSGEMPERVSSSDLPICPMALGLAGRCHQADAAALNQHRSRVYERLIVAARLTRHCVRAAWVFEHRNRLAGEHRFIGRQVVATEQHGICCDTIAFLEQDQVARRYLASRDALLLAVAYHQCTRAGKVAQRFQHPFALVLLGHGQGYDEQHEEQQHQRVFNAAKQQVDSARGDQQ